MNPIERIPGPELMLGEEQVRAYAEADFEEPHGRFIHLFRELFPEEKMDGYVLDLGCGPADISLRMARAYPSCVVHGIDGSETMLKLGSRTVLRVGLEDQVQLFHVYLPAKSLPRKKYDVVISNSLLHHLRDPEILWATVKNYARPGAPVLVMDLLRPASKTQAKRLVKEHARGEAPVLKRDFYHSLLAAYRPDEVRAQLQSAKLTHFEIRVVSDRHQVIFGKR